MKIILGSNSPRRAELLKQMGYAFDVHAFDFTEEINLNLPYAEIPSDIARQKINALKDSCRSEDILICADTLVFINERSLGKPSSASEAKTMLSELSGATHEVITGVGILHQGTENYFSDRTAVSMRTLTEAEIEYYITTDKPFDKAGSYGIQDWIGLIAIGHIAGSYTNVLGLPTQKLQTVLADLMK